MDSVKKCFEWIPLKNVQNGFRPKIFRMDYFENAQNRFLRKMFEQILLKKNGFHDFKNNQIGIFLVIFLYITFFQLIKKVIVKNPLCLQRAFSKNKSCKESVICF